jgi:hypothetical protein
MTLPLEKIRHGDWLIYPNLFNAHPEAWRVGWIYAHEDYDGAPDGNDHRCGACESIEACKAEIDDYEADR